MPLKLECFCCFHRYAPRDERFYKSREELRRERIERESSVDPEKSSLARSCSLRRSMKSLFKSSDKEKSKSIDLWADGRPKSPGPPMVDLRQKRSRSLPRALNSVKNSVSKLVARSRCASAEGLLDDGDNDGAKSRKNKDKQLEPSEFVTHVAKRKPRGLLRSMTKRISKSQTHLQTVAVNKPMPKSMSASQNIRPQSLDVRFDAARCPIPVSSPTTPQSADTSTSGAPPRELRPSHR